MTRSDSEDPNLPVTSPVFVLVSSPTSDVRDFLSDRLGHADFEILGVEPGRAFADAVMRVRPDIAVIDRIDERPEVARAEITYLKENCPKVKIIALSKESSAKDAAIVEQGVCFYLAEDWKPRLVQVTESVARSLRTTRLPKAERVFRQLRPPSEEN